MKFQLIITALSLALLLSGCGKDTPISETVNASLTANAASNLMGKAASQAKQLNDPAIEFFITEKARDMISKIMDAKPDKTHLLVSVKPGGCSGFTYQLSLDTITDLTNYVVINSSGIDVAIPKDNAKYLDGTKLDWQVTESGKAGFHFDNPNTIKIDHTKKGEIEVNREKN